MLNFHMVLYVRSYFKVMCKKLHLHKFRSGSRAMAKCVGRRHGTIKVFSDLR